MQSLRNQLLIAMPRLEDENFSRTVTFLCDHSEAGAMGIMINRSTTLQLGEVLEQLDIEPVDLAIAQRTVFLGGPVQTDRGFVLHDDASREWDASLRIEDDLQLTSSRDILEAIARGEGPKNSLLVLGYAGWGPGQLEAELLENSWLTAPSRRELLFDTPVEKRWEAAAQSIGIPLDRIADHSGHA